jgi:phage protein U
MFAVLGDVPFEIVGSPEAFSDSRGYDYAEQRVAQARPRLQWLADDLVTIRFEMLLHLSFTNPTASLLILRQAAETHSAMPLIFGNGDFRGYFVITGIDTVSRQLSGIGEIFAITVRLALRESPVEFNAGAPAIPSFIPIALAATTSSSSSTPIAAAGVSALVALASPSAPPGPVLLAEDVPTSVIVRSAQ